MDNKNLFKEAIADAKAVREAALANAKAALEEALTPKLQSMLATKLQEMEYEEEAMGEEEEMEEGFTTSHGDDSDENLDFNLEEEMEDESMMDEDFDLSEILAELEDEEEKEMKEKLNKGGYTGSLKDKDEKTTVATAKADTVYSKLSEAKEEDEEESESVSDMSVEDLKSLIKDIVSQEIEAEEAEGPEAEEEEAGEESMSADGEESDEINLDELLAELDALGEGEEEEMEEGLGDTLKKGIKKVGQVVSGAAARAKYVVGATPEDTKGALNLNLSAKQVFDIVKANYEKRTGKTGEPSDTYKSLVTLRPQGFDSTGGEVAKEAQEMQEAIRTINTLRSELNEVNLLNAKLLYVNKIFKAKNLSESQKLKVIASFDKATTAKEAKIVFESLNANLTAAPKQAIKESLGFASRAAGTAPRKAIVETNDAITRMQKLANIIK
jgi:hypothetical protein